MNLPVAVVTAVFLLIAVRRLGPWRLPIWLIMLGGAATVVLAGAIGPSEAVAAINPDVMLFLFGVFVIGQALEASGYLYHLSYRLFRGARSVETLLWRILFGAGIASAFLMNDTLAIIGTPLVLKLAQEHRLPPKVLLLALAFGVTLGSVMSPIGNPQNLLIAIQGQIENPFVDFFQHLAVPTLINLGLTFVLLRYFYHDNFQRQGLRHARVAVRDRGLARLARLSLLLLIALAGLKVLLALVQAPFNIELTWIALLAAAPVLCFSPRRREILRDIDWHTLVFFATMFVLMASLWQTGFLQSQMTSLGIDLTSTALIFAVGVLLSQLISNVPLVALLLPLLLHAGAATPALLALAAGSTVAGNLLILGAASNVIIIQNAEKRAGVTIGFLEFARVGIPLTLVNVLVYWAFLTSW